MNDMTDAARDHYRADGLTGRLREALAPLGPEEQILTPQRLAALDQFHTRGLAATATLTAMIGIAPDTAVLDVGAGIGGPARFVAESCGCRVTGLDLSEAFVEGARYLTRRTGQENQVSFVVGSALAMPFADAAFDIVLLQHVAMNIADRDGLYREIARVLRPGGTFATHDVVMRKGDPLYPVPWARNAEASFLMSAETTRDAVEQTGFRTIAWHDDSDAAKAWFTQLRSDGPPPPPNLGVVMGRDFAQSATNLGRNVMEERLGVLTALFERTA